MSKSRGNVITPDAYVSELGADAVRAYLMFVAPWEMGGEWNDSGISGISRWVNRIWNLVLEEYAQRKKEEVEVTQRLKSENVDYEQTVKESERVLERVRHQTIRKVTQDMERIRFNIMIAALMEYTNYLNEVKQKRLVTLADWQESIRVLLLLLAPSVPHMAEELWQLTGREYSIHNQSWPVWDEELAKDEEITLVVQVNGKLRDRIAVPASISEAEAREKALDSQRVQAHLKGKEPTDIIYVPSRLVNLVVR
jgi:leucyl-tRNA synthetase